MQYLVLWLVGLMFSQQPLSKSSFAMEIRFLQVSSSSRDIGIGFGFP
jgi:hypothetical protein